MLEQAIRPNPLSLQIVPLDKVFPHELLDPRRVDRLVNRLRSDQKLINPPIVVPLEDYYVVLDGATRVMALQRLGFPHIAVQQVADPDKLGLHTWYHVICQISLDGLLNLLQSLPKIVVAPSEPKKVLDDMLEYGGICYLHTVEGQVWLIQPAVGVNRLEALSQLTAAYIQEAGQVRRTINRNIATLRQEQPHMAALVVFPEYTVEQVLQIAQAKHALPAGITRFIIPGRVLRLNIPLEVLRSPQSLQEKNEWLYQQVMELLSSGKARYYEEPVYLLDE
ncbi:MAG: hypothetical protein U0401_11300 [Anaerolineae bacterium]